jgi:hypothetical protein
LLDRPRLGFVGKPKNWPRSHSVILAPLAFQEEIAGEGEAFSDNGWSFLVLLVRIVDDSRKFQLTHALPELARTTRIENLIHKAPLGSLASFAFCAQLLGTIDATLLQRFHDASQ